MSLPNFPRLAVSVQDTCRWAEQSDLFGSSVHYDKRAIESFYSFCRQDRRMHVLKWAAQNVPNRSKECCAVLAMLCEEFEKACCGLYRAHSSSDLLTTSPTRLLRQPMMRRQGMDNYPVPIPLATHLRYRSTQAVALYWFWQILRQILTWMSANAKGLHCCTLNFRLFLSRACVQGRLKFCILSFARVIDIDATAAKQVKTSVDKAARTWLCQTVKACRTVERKWKTSLWQSMAMSEFAHAESLSICLGSVGLFISEALVRSGVQVFFCRMSGSIFQEKFQWLCALYASVRREVEMDATFSFHQQAFSKSHCSWKFVHVSSLFGWHTFTTAQRSRITAKGSSLVNPKDFKSVGVPLFSHSRLRLICICNAYVSLSRSLYITMSMSYTFIYHLYMNIFRSFHSYIIYACIYYVYIYTYLL